MEDNKSKRDFRLQYKEREIIGGVYVIKNTLNNKVLLDVTADLRSSKNRFEFSVKTGSCIHMKLQNDWSKGDGGQFVFEVLEELKKEDTQTIKEFKADIDILKEIWLEKFFDKDLY